MIHQRIKTFKNSMAQDCKIRRIFIKDIPILGSFLCNATKDGIDTDKNYASSFVNDRYV